MWSVSVPVKGPDLHTPKFKMKAAGTDSGQTAAQTVESFRV